jgi:2-hydroxy-3-keto-5-methylthiopentenyl-1-phosphate phosphatase
MTDIDGGELALRLFAKGDWLRYDHELEEGNITLEECLRRQFSMIRAGPDEIIRTVLPSVSLRTGARELVHSCRSKGIPFGIVSGGLDFLIGAILQRDDIEGIDIFAPRAIPGASGMGLRFPKPRNREGDFKSSVVGRFKSRGFQVFYLGDGVSDLGAVRRANRRYVISDSNLARLCRNSGLSFTEISDLNEVVSDIMQET